MSSPALDPAWLWWMHSRDLGDCTCAAPECAQHRDWCAVTPIYATVASAVGLPRFRWPLWMHYLPSCDCEPANDETQYAGALSPDCEIHGEQARAEAQRWLR